MTKKKLTLICPIRGVLKAAGRSKDGLSPTEEYARVESIKYLIKQGYPKENFKIETVIKKFGNSGRNSFRSDFIVLDTPVNSINSRDVDELLNHALILCEVKKDNSNFDYVKHTQIKPMLDFSKLEKTIGLYWDNVEQRVFWQEWFEGSKIIREGTLALLPNYGANISIKPLTLNDLKPTDSLLDVFSRIEDILHQASIDPQQRYEVILQFILAKLFDEHAHYNNKNAALSIQDFSQLQYKNELALREFNKVLNNAVTYYEKHLPKKIDKQLNLRPNVLVDILKILAPIRLTAAKREVVQKFYMKFAKDLYRWDLAQFFTPTTVTDFIVDVLNPRFGEHIKDPACGSADFLTAAFHKGRVYDSKFADCIWGADNSLNAVQVSVLNMLLNGDGKTNIVHEDSLENVNKYKENYQILVCNPPFGTRIVEKRNKVLKLFDLGHEWSPKDNGILTKTNNVLTSNEAGILFVELCIKQTEPKGRIGIILPNGYLGNRSIKYYTLREYILRHCKVVSICSFPRFTFKTSGADVSASVVFLEKRETPLSSSSEDKDYSFNVEMIQNVGWDVGNKKAAPIYKRNEEDGSYIINENGGMIIDADFDTALKDLRNSKVALDSTWLLDENQSYTGDGWSVSIGDVLVEENLTLDPKRYCKKIYDLREKITSKPYVKIGDIVDVIPQLRNSNGMQHKKQNKKIYNYIELQDIGYGEYRSLELRGWELPDRAKHFAEAGDIYVGSIWGSVQKWCLIGPEQDNYVVTNGCYRLRIKEGKEDYLLDLIVFLSSEAYATQMRAFARGSDGLAEVHETDLKEVLVPLITNQETRREFEPFLQNLLNGKQNLKNTVEGMINSGELSHVPKPPKRPNHAVLV